MLRIIIREVSDIRIRNPKSLAVADVEPFLALSTPHPRPGQDTHVATLYLCTSGGHRRIAASQFTPSVTPARNVWRYVAEALASALPPGDLENLPKLTTRPQSA